MKSVINEIFLESIKTKELAREKLADEIENSAKTLIDALNQGNKILVCGNGGSASDAQHFAAELTVRFEKERGPLPAIALHCDTSAVTACGNDYGYDHIFERQVKALGREGDILVAISSSGNSLNVMKAVDAANQIGMGVVMLLGKDGGKMKHQINKSCLIAPSSLTARIQETHITIIHIWCRLIDDAMCNP